MSCRVELVVITAALADILSDWGGLVFMIERRVLQSWLVSRLLRVSCPINTFVRCVLFVDLVAGAVWLLDFELE